MEQFLSEISIETNGEGIIDITHDINKWIQAKNILKGIVVITAKHTSCSLIINENADTKVLQDLSSYIKAIVPENGFKSISGEGNIKPYLHSEEGIDDMPAHIRTTLTASSLTISIDNSQLDIGVWQAIYLWEHRYSQNIRKLNLHSICETLSSQENKEGKNFHTLISKTNASKLNKLVANDKENSYPRNEKISDTKMDLIIDRIHDLTNERD